MPHSKRFALVCVAVTVLALLNVACEKRIHEANTAPQKATDTPATASTQPGDSAATPAAAVIPATTGKTPSTQSQPILALLTINGLGAEFPTTKLLMHKRDADGRFPVELYSDLPKSALRKYDGNELYLEMKLDYDPSDPKLHERTDVDPWKFKSTSSGRVDSPNGIFLHGQATHLQPQEVWVKFEHEDGRLIARITGEFRSFESGTPDALAPSVGVQGTLPVEISQKR